MRKPLIAVVGAAVILAIAGCGGDAEPETAAAKPAAEALTVSGKLTLKLPNFEWNPGTCTGRNALANVAQGAEVVVTDNAGTTVGLGKLGPGEPTLNPADQTRAESCAFMFAVGDVLAGKGFYGVEVAGHGRVQFPEAQLGERVDLELS